MEKDLLIQHLKMKISLLEDLKDIDSSFNRQLDSISDDIERYKTRKRMEDYNHNKSYIKREVTLDQIVF